MRTLYVAFVFNIFAHKNVDVCFMEEGAGITAGDVYVLNSVFKDGERERQTDRRTDQSGMTQRLQQQRFVCSDYFIEFSSPRTGINASMQRKPANKTVYYLPESSRDVQLVNL
jgi:hypothetical protein